MRDIHHTCACLIAVFLAVSAADAAESDIRAIEKTYKAWVEVSNEKDIEKWSLFLAEDPYFSPSDAPPLTNRDAILAYYEKAFDQGF